MNRYQTQYGPWAIVTGASSGIGEQFARQLAAQGLNLILVARNQEKLDRLATALVTSYQIKTRVIAADLADQLGLEKVKSESDQYNVGLLVNNAGVEQSGSFFRYADQQTRQLLELNVLAPIELARHVGEQMVTRGRGGIVFVASALGYQGVPLFANYAASKATLINLAESLHYELKPLGIDVLGLSPGVTHTPMASRLSTETNFGSIGLRSLTPAYVARVGLRNLGRRATVITGFQYKFFGMLTKWVLPRSFSAWMFGKLMKRALRDKSLAAPPVPGAERASVVTAPNPV